MSSSKIKAGLWVQAQIRQCDINVIPLMVRQKGDPDSGAILLKLDLGEAGCSVLSQVRDVEGNPGWMYGGGGEIIAEEEAESYIKRQIQRDPDLWVIEIEDRQGRYELDGKIV
ncbi:MAG: DUF1491 family protein [Rhodospirillaceae bacterium]|jgi:hypothetical protein|nr:DUF1491 family protein [Rhodospirillaceae bacterium]MBT5244547.1 DUF1491 family protein [Rhodospirillaceae bacterium]MBT5562857.1 DUF1491 family protein [Rhodospirillaceae bacterium]MBT6242503.1 DUF1491 family protein [Rhodospirillaceae bacterium]MBT7137955.1 DUF1491 family protein [Rhodospirillaceae bacterium]